MKPVLTEFEKYLKNKNAKIITLLQEGYEKEKIANAFSYNHIQPLSVMIDLYEWKNGVVLENNLPIEQQELFPEGIMLSLESTLEYYKLYTAINNLWDARFFPLFTNGGGDFILIDISVNSTNQLYLFAPAILLSGEPVSIYDSLEQLFKTVIVCFEKGAYSVNESDLLVINYDLKYEIAAQLNPLSEYWKS